MTLRINDVKLPLDHAEADFGVAVADVLNATSGTAHPAVAVADVINATTSDAAHSAVAKIVGVTSDKAHSVAALANGIAATSDAK